MIKINLSLVCRMIPLVCLPFVAHAQQAASTLLPTVSATPGDVFSSELGQVAGHGEGKAQYSVAATQPKDSKLTSQKIRLIIVQNTATGTSTRSLTINTGKYKTVSQTSIIVADIFSRFLADSTALSHEIGKIGDVKYGTQIRFVIESADSLRYDILSAEGPVSGGGHFDRDATQAFVTILGPNH